MRETVETIASPQTKAHPARSRGVGTTDFTADGADERSWDAVGCDSSHRSEVGGMTALAAIEGANPSTGVAAAERLLGEWSGWDSPRARVGGDGSTFTVAEAVSQASLPDGDVLAWYSPLGGGWKTSGRGNGAVRRPAITVDAAGEVLAAVDYGPYGAPVLTSEVAVSEIELAILGWDSPRARSNVDGTTLRVAEAVPHATLPEGDALAWDSPLGAGAAPAFSYTGKPYDAATGLYHFPYRQYDPNAARWLTRDPLGMVDGPNVYAYVMGNPVGHSDPLGLQLMTHEVHEMFGAGGIGPNCGVQTCRTKIWGIIPRIPGVSHVEPAWSAYDDLPGRPGPEECDDPHCRDTTRRYEGYLIDNMGNRGRSCASASCRDIILCLIKNNAGCWGSGWSLTNNCNTGTQRGLNNCCLSE